MKCVLQTLCHALMAPHADSTTTFLARIITMVDTLTTKTDALAAKTDEMLTKLQAAAARDAVQAQALSDIRVELENLKAVVVPLPVDTSAAESAIDSVLAKLDAAEAQIDALDAAPVAVPVPTEPTPVDTGAPVSPDAPANPDAPVNPNA